jgi:Tannase and feruloyl esterase
MLLRERFTTRLSWAMGVGVAVASLLSGCSSADGTVPNATSVNSDNNQSDNDRGRPMQCTQLVNKKIPASFIGLPTTGATVTAATTVAATDAGTASIGEYCLVSGNIMPVDPTAPNIEFQLALPTAWNEKVLMLGGGGFDGSIPPVTSNTPNGAADGSVPLGRGYAVFGSDSGHQDTSNGGGPFSVNQEAYLNFMGDALKKTHDAALVLVKEFYGVRRVKKSYFAGGSTGGRESLTVIQRWPEDWDGAIALYPAWDFTALTLMQLTATEAFAAPGAFLDSAKRGVLYNAVLAACDTLDGVADGLISNVQDCQATFNPTTVRCPGGADTGDTCLSDAQLTALNIMNSPLIFNFELASGETSYPGYNVFVADTGIPSSSPFEGIVSLLALGAVQPAFPVTSSMMFDGQISDSFIRYTVMDDPTFDSLTFNTASPGPFASRVSYLSSLDAVITDLTPFAAKGGKLLLAHGTADLTVSTRATEFYFQKMQAVMDVDDVATFVRFYEIPGLQHAFSTVFNAAWDNLTALENWVEKGIDPAMNQTVTDTLGVPGRTRPLCLYPTYPKYNGSGDVNLASSFTCGVP